MIDQFELVQHKKSSSWESTLKRIADYINNLIHDAHVNKKDNEETNLTQQMPPLCIRVLNIHPQQKIQETFQCSHTCRKASSINKCIKKKKNTESP